MNMLYKLFQYNLMILRIILIIEYKFSAVNRIYPTV